MNVYVETLKLVLDAYPDAVNHTSKCNLGKTALHMAVLAIGTHTHTYIYIYICIYIYMHASFLLMKVCLS